jgi:hypothetical protein
VNAVMNLRVPKNAGNFSTSWKPISFWRMTLPHEVSNTDIRRWHNTYRVKKDNFTLLQVTQLCFRDIHTILALL